MSGKATGIEKKIVLLRMPKPLYDAIMQTSTGLSAQSIILNTLRMKYHGKTKPRKPRQNSRSQAKTECGNGSNSR